MKLICTLLCYCCQLASSAQIICPGVKWTIISNNAPNWVEIKLGRWEQNTVVCNTRGRLLIKLHHSPDEMAIPQCPLKPVQRSFTRSMSHNLLLSSILRLPPSQAVGVEAKRQEMFNLNTCATGRHVANSNWDVIIPRRSVTRSVLLSIPAQHFLCMLMMKFIISIFKHPRKERGDSLCNR